MVTRSHPHFAAGLVAAVYLFLGGGGAEAFGAHRCPHHDALPGTPAPAGAQHGHGSYGGDGQQAGGGGHGGPASVCLCIGTCQVGGALEPTPSRVVLRKAAPTSGDVAPVVGSDVLPPTLLPYVLPYGTAPPLGL